MTPKKFNKILNLLIIASILISAGSFLFFWGKLKVKGRSIYEKEVILNNFTSKVNSLEALKRNYEKISGQAEEVLYSIPPIKNPDLVMTSIEKAAKGKNVKLTSFRYAENSQNKKKKTTKDATMLKTVKKDDYFEMPLQITLEGSYKDVLGVIKDLESSKRLITFRDINITKTGSEDDAVRIILNLSAYIKKE